MSKSFIKAIVFKIIQERSGKMGKVIPPPYSIASHNFYQDKSKFSLKEFIQVIPYLNHFALLISKLQILIHFV